MPETLKKIKELRPIRWSEKSETVFLIDQKILPYEFKYIEIKDELEMAEAIKDMTVRGAPAIGIAAAYGVVLAIKNIANDLSVDTIKIKLEETDKVLRNTRPTAVNLMWALDEIQKISNDFANKEDLYNKLLDKAHHILEDDINRCKAMAEHGAKYIKEKFADKISQGKKLNILTHCNAGALATGGYGTALGVIRTLDSENLVEMVYADETRPRQQGARLTAWELAYDQIATTLITDNMAAHLMKQGHIDLVVVGSDRIAKNGDAANKIGTYQLAITANYHKLPFFVAAPMSSFDLSLDSGETIPIEERDHREVSHINGRTCTVDEANSLIENYDLESNSHRLGNIDYQNPAFDVTPNHLIEAIFTENGVYNK